MGDESEDSINYLLSQMDDVLSKFLPS